MKGNKARLKNMLVCRHPGLIFEYIRPVGKVFFQNNFDMEKYNLHATIMILA